MDYSITALFNVGIIVVVVVIGGRWVLVRIINKKDKDE